MRFPLILAALVVAGCLGDDPAPPPDAVPSARGEEGTPAVGDEGLAAPALPVGRAWTYDAAIFYDPPETVTVVVASNASGYLFAGATPEDLVGEILWGRFWHGEVDEQLSTPDWRLFEFPLVDGKTWDLFEGVVVTARATDVQALGRTMPGFAMTATVDANAYRWEYAPEIGYLTKYERTRDGEMRDSLYLRAMRDGAPWLWFEMGAFLEATDRGAFPPEAPIGGDAQRLEVPEGSDAVVASGGGAGGGRAELRGVGGESWTWEAADEESWGAAVFEAPSATWTLAAVSPPEGFGWLCAAAVTWVRDGAPG